MEKIQEVALGRGAEARSFRNNQGEGHGDDVFVVFLLMAYDMVLKETVNREVFFDEPLFLDEDVLFFFEECYMLSLVYHNSDGKGIFILPKCVSFCPTMGVTICLPSAKSIVIVLNASR